MDVQSLGTSRDEIWRLQEALNELSATQQQHSDRIMKLEKRQDDGGRARNFWGPSSPYPPGMSGPQQESTLNPAAEAFRNFDAEPPHAMISSLTLDHNEDHRRAAASRANSVRFDESANNHYAPSRSSIDLPTRTGSGLGSHPLSERSLSHRSERGSTSGFGRANSFGLESSRLLGSIHNSPRVSGNPPPGFFVLGPCPAIVRCWLTETFSNDSLLYAAICTGSSTSSIGLSLLHRLGLTDTIIEENGLRKIKLLVYMTEAKIYMPSSRSASPAPQVPTITAKFLIHDHQPALDKSIQLVLGSDVLREHNADVLFSQDKVMIYDNERNHLSVPLVRPEDDAVYKNLCTRPRSRRGSLDSDAMQPEMLVQHPAPGIIGRPGRVNSQVPLSPLGDSVSGLSIHVDPRRGDQSELSAGSMGEGQARAGDDSKSTTGSEKSATGPASKPSSGVWANSWRSSTGPQSENQNLTRSTSSSYSRPTATRQMKVLRPSGARGTTSSTRLASGASTSNLGLDTGTENSQSTINNADQRQQPNSAEPKTPAAKSNPVGGGSAFPWLSQPQARKSTATK